ncbi:hypothetical protein [Acetobacter sacchari]|uniref:hypothetical protein n=1 Tax=Acetobacter sacchari TaxID=2661687 RepID=UPI001FB03524|nr:hypothetical protein [Acetobacter sacchari]
MTIFSHTSAGKTGFRARSAFALVLLCGTFARALAAPPPGGCARISHDGGSGGAMTHVHVSMDDGAATLDATRETYTGSDDSVADAASVLLLSAFIGLHKSACSAWLEAEGKQAEADLADKQKLSVGWTGAHIRRHELQLGLGDARLSVSIDGTQANANLSMSGVSVTGVSAPSLAPQSAAAAFSLPLKDVATLMAATGGKPSSMPAVHVTINSLTARREQVQFTGHGVATLTGDVNHTSASGHLEVRHIKDLIDLARQDSQMRVAAALVLARLVSHRDGDVSAWDTTWEGGVLTVNGVPLPLK